MKNDGMAPLENPRHEIFALELAVGAHEEDAWLTAGGCHPMPMQPGESIPARVNKVQRQMLRRLDARLELLGALRHSAGREDSVDYRIRTDRARAELLWARSILLNGGCEPEFDDEGQRIPAADAKGV